MANHPKVIVETHLIPTVYLSIWWVAIYTWKNDMHINCAKAHYWETNRKGVIKMFIYWYSFEIF